MKFVEFQSFLARAGLCILLVLAPSCFDNDRINSDAGTGVDADGGPSLDAANPPDAGDADAGESDAGPVDAGETDAGLVDAGETDAGPMDAGPSFPGMVIVPPGAFWRGCNDAIDTHCSEDEKPGSSVTLKSFAIDITEVTQGAYAGCVAAGACSDAHPTSGTGCPYAPDISPNHPMICVDWNDADTFCRWAEKRLPTEAEWEKAARGTDGRLYPWGNDAPDCTLANETDCSTGLSDVGTHSGDSPYGVKDMAGNVWEWVADWYHPTYYATAPSSDPPGPPQQGPNGRIGRGGGFEMLPNHVTVEFLRTSFRHEIQPQTFRIGIGFRCARSLP